MRSSSGDSLCGRLEVRGITEYTLREAECSGQDIESAIENYLEGLSGRRRVKERLPIKAFCPQAYDFDPLYVTILRDITQAVGTVKSR